MTKLLSALLLLAIIIAPAHAATIYKWTDKEGQVHYTRTPPPESMSSEKVEGKDADKVPPARVEKTPVVKEPAKQPPIAAVMSPEEKRRQELCQSAQQDLYEMRRTDKVLEHGHEIEITEEERLRRLDELNALVKEHCTPREPQPVQQPVQPVEPQQIQQPGSQSARQPAPQPIHNSVPQQAPLKMDKAPEQPIHNPQTPSNQ